MAFRTITEEDPRKIGDARSTIGRHARMTYQKETNLLNFQVDAKTKAVGGHT